MTPARTRLLALAAAGALLASGCAKSDFRVGTREFAQDIILGDQSKSPAPAPVPGSNPVPVGFPSFLQPVPPRVLTPGALPVATRPPKLRGPCPAADPNDAALLAAGNRSPLPPKAGSYTFRNAPGGFTQTGAARTALPELSRRTVSDIRQGGQSFEYDVAETLGDATTTNRFEVRNDGPTPERGLYLVRTTSGRDVFQPRPRILIMPFPPPEFGTNLEDEAAQTAGPTFRSAGTDPEHQVTMALEGRLNPEKDRVDACGEWVDAINVVITSGRIVAPGKDVTFKGRYGVATQYGGLIVRDEIEQSGTEGLTPVSRKNTATIAEVPREPAGD
ncbi:MAG TPA: hypothetical protein VNE62_09415 [Actinomycetota bacterium]|nr:hypothetical protein [Actinomycetota bacterium]